MEIDVSTPPAGERSSLDLKELTLKTLEANKGHQYALTKRAEQLTKEIAELERLMSASTASDGEESDTEIHIPGAKRVKAPFPVSEFLRKESPFFEDASRRMRYLNDITEHPMKNRELEALADAVRSENQRLQAYESQKHGQSGITIDIENNTEGLDWNVIAEKVSSVSTYKRTADQCRIKWLGDRHPKINHNDWDAAELENLQNLVTTQLEQNDGTVDWVLVAKSLGTNRNPLDCMRRGLPRQRHTWNHISDKKLFDAVQLYGTGNWNLVARVVSEDATAGQCQGRYFRALDPSLKRGAWSDDEFARLKAAVSAHGNAWVDVASCIPGRTNEQCRERWMEYLKAGSAPPVWSEEDDGVLLDAVAAMGNQWKAISTKLTNGATGAQCRLRHDKLKKLHGLQISAAAGPSTTAKRKHDDPSTAKAKKPRARNTAGTPQAEEEAGSTSVPAAVPKARPRPRPVGNKGKQKEPDSETNPTPSTLTPEVSTEQGISPPVDDNSMPVNRKRRAAGEGAAVKKRKIAQAEGTVPEHEAGAGASNIPGARTSPRRRTTSTPALLAPNDRAAPTESNMPKRKGRAEATTGNDADKIVPPPRRPVGRPRKTVAAPVDSTAGEASLAEPRPKPRPRGRPRKVVPPEAPLTVDELSVLPSEQAQPLPSSAPAPSISNTQAVSATSRRQSARVAAQQPISYGTPQPESDDAMVVDSERPADPAVPVSAALPTQETDHV
ncbi:snRNA-activating protein complex subunit 4 [Hypsizygus marmoreus]|uniref:snRNA-activating protein complex subunit 4 n=1 Tax=Hypsizygus marmoreus TaxID=39966 RepID=A0A369JRQ2_HYPMA|nr:snRNA-activating protein complex subunit 4 [Hypsizygus marmoreus]